MRLAARAPGLLLIAAGVAGALEASTFDVAFMTDPVGPKALPYLVAAIFALAGTHVAFRPRAGIRCPPRPVLVRTGAATVAFLVYAAALPWVGFFASTTLVVATLSLLFGAAPRRALPAAALLSAVLWVVFVRVLGLPLPIGDLWIR